MAQDSDRLTLEWWEELAADQQVDIARRIAHDLGAPWQFVGLALFALGGQQHRIARFVWQDATFHLVPGGSPTLGYDRTQPFVLNKAQRRESKIDLWYQQGDAPKWKPADDVDEPPVDDDVANESLHSYLDGVLTPLRRCHISAFLIEVEAFDAEEGLVPRDADLPAEHFTR
jgi:hypothetical protein